MIGFSSLLLLPPSSRSSPLILPPLATANSQYSTTMKCLHKHFATVLAVLAFGSTGSAFVQPNVYAKTQASSSLHSSTAAAAPPSSPWFTGEDNESKSKLKTQILQLGAALDRGQSYNPTSGSYYESSMEVARSKIQSLIALADSSNVPASLEDIAGEWELVFTTVKHGIFRSSPFFLAVQEAFEYAEEKEVCIAMQLLCFVMYLEQLTLFHLLCFRHLARTKQLYSSSYMNFKHVVGVQAKLAEWHSESTQRLDISTLSSIRVSFH